MYFSERTIAERLDQTKDEEYRFVAMFINKRSLFFL